MSTNKMINAVIAMIEDRPQDAREMLRSPEMGVSSSELQMRLAIAIRVIEGKASITVLKSILHESLRVDTGRSEEFLKGVTYVEELIDGKIGLIEACIEPETVPRPVPTS